MKYQHNKHQILILLFLCIVLIGAIVFSIGTEKNFKGFLHHNVRQDGTVQDAPLTRVLGVPGGIDYTEVPLQVYRCKIIAVDRVYENEPIEVGAYPVWMTYFRVHITYNYTTEEVLDHYVTAYYTGTDRYVEYGTALPQIGEEFILGENNLRIMKTFGLHHLYRILDIDGKEYALPYSIATEYLEGGMTPPEEYRWFYTKEHDREILSYLEENQIRNIENDRLFTVEELTTQLVEIQRNRNEALKNGSFVWDPEHNYNDRPYRIWIPYEEKG